MRSASSSLSSSGKALRPSEEEVPKVNPSGPMATSGAVPPGPMGGSCGRGGGACSDWTSRPYWTRSSLVRDGLASHVQRPRRESSVAKLLPRLARPTSTTEAEREPEGALERARLYCRLRRCCD